ncbi:HET domain protein [Apiospora hydei]|uniref:HET domain protein n=1 Tax=Apiospora hydei TaxID=1337664 RepID=A0ABR1WBM8_9PEZI
MRLIDVKTLRLHEFYDERLVPKYAILSHTWSNEEVALQEYEHLLAGGPGADVTYAKQGYMKIVAACKAADELGLRWCWADTCCIDKKSSAELTEAINSMFKWYLQADVCLAYLDDLDVMTEAQHRRGEEPLMESCRWEWNAVAYKSDIQEFLSKITGINQRVLEDPTRLSTIPVACRLAWASQRETTRVEDQAYCLLGLFDINMPLLYGEGTKAFLRLQQEILRQDGDLSLFAWQPDAGQHETYMDMFAPSPAQFASSFDTLSKSEGNFHTRNVCSVTSRGIQISKPIAVSGASNDPTTSSCYYISLGCYSKSLGPWVLKLQMVGPGVYVRMRQNGGFWFQVSLDDWDQLDIGDIFVLPTTPHTAIQSIQSYHRGSICFNPMDLRTTRFTEPRPVEAFDFANRRFLTRDLPNFRAYIKFVPDASKEDAFCVLLLRIVDRVNQEPQPTLFLLHSDVWTKNVAGRYFASTDQLVEHSIRLADKTGIEPNGGEQLAVGRYLCSASLITVEAQGEPVHHITIDCAETTSPDITSGASLSRAQAKKRDSKRH